MAATVSLFASLYPTAAVNAHKSGQYAQAIGVVQHKVNQLRALGYGRLTYAELRAAGVVDAEPTSSPYAFTGPTGPGQSLCDAVGSITIEAAGPALSRVTVRLQWQSSSTRSVESSHEVIALIANE